MGPGSKKRYGVRKDENEKKPSGRNGDGFTVRWAVPLRSMGTKDRRRSSNRWLRWTPVIVDGPQARPVVVCICTLLCMPMHETKRMHCFLLSFFFKEPKKGKKWRIDYIAERSPFPCFAPIPSAFFLLFFWASFLSVFVAFLPLRMDTYFPFPYSLGIMFPF